MDYNAIKANVMYYILFLKQSSFYKNFDKSHANLVEHLFIDQQNNSTLEGVEPYLIHLVHYQQVLASKYFNTLRRYKTRECQLCNGNLNTKEALVNINNNKQHIISFLSALGIPYSVVRNVFRCFNIVVNDENGMYGFDVNNLIVAYIDQYLYTSSDFVYIGILYACSDLNKHYEYITKNFGSYNDIWIVRGSGTMHLPEHWSAVYISVKMKTLFYYNSLGPTDKRPVDESFFQFLKQLSKFSL